MEADTSKLFARILLPTFQKKGYRRLMRSPTKIIFFFPPYKTHFPPLDPFFHTPLFAENRSCFFFSRAYAERISLPITKKMLFLNCLIIHSTKKTIVQDIQQKKCTFQLVKKKGTIILQMSCSQHFLFTLSSCSFAASNFFWASALFFAIFNSFSFCLTSFDAALSFLKNPKLD